MLFRGIIATQTFQFELRLQIFNRLLKEIRYNSQIKSTIPLWLLLPILLQSFQLLIILWWMFWFCSLFLTSLLIILILCLILYLLLTLLILFSIQLVFLFLLLFFWLLHFMLGINASQLQKNMFYIWFILTILTNRWESKNA